MCNMLFVWVGRCMLQVDAIVPCADAPVVVPDNAWHLQAAFTQLTSVTAIASLVCKDRKHVREAIIAVAATWVHSQELMFTKLHNELRS